MVHIRVVGVLQLVYLVLGAVINLYIDFNGIFFTAAARPDTRPKDHWQAVRANHWPQGLFNHGRTTWEC